MCTDSVVAAGNISGMNGHRTLAEEKLSVDVDVSPRLSARPCFACQQDACFTPFDRLASHSTTNGNFFNCRRRQQAGSLLGVCLQLLWLQFFISRNRLPLLFFTPLPPTFPLRSSEATL